MPTIHEVADRAGVSIATVSRVFTRPEVVARATRDRVVAAARDLGYSPSTAARALVRRRAGYLGLLVHDLANPFYAAIVKGVQREARRAGLLLFCADYGDDPADELHLARDTARQVDGLLLYSARPPDDGELLEAVAGLGPVVLLDNPVPEARAVLMSTRDGVTQAVEHLGALGHDAVTYVAGSPPASYPAADRLRTVGDACRASGVALTVLGPFQPTFEAGVRAADLVIAGGATAVIAFNDQMALGLIRRLTERGVRVGADVSVVGVDDTWFAAQTTPALTTVRMPCAEAGATAARLLLDALGDGAGTGPATPSTVTLPTELIVRDSTGPVPARPDSTGGPR